MPTVNATLGQQYEIMSGVGINEAKTVTFDQSTTGAIGTHVLFRVTGTVSVKIYPKATAAPVGASGTVALGTTLLPTAFITTTTATAINTNFNWIATPAAAVADTVTNFPVLVTSEDIILTIATTALSGGSLSFNAIWKPLTEGASLVAAAIGSSSSASASPSSSTSPSASASKSVSPSASASRSLSPSNSASPSSSESASASASLSPSASASSSSSASLSPSASASASASPSSSVSASLSPSASASRSQSPSSSTSASLSPSASASVSVSASLSPSSSVSPSQEFPL